MRTRLSSRLIVLNPLNEVLLFQFVHIDDALSGKSYWATPGGGVKDGETDEEAACRELQEETGIVRNAIGKSLANRTFEMTLPSGEKVIAREKYFIVNVHNNELNFSLWTKHEKKVMHDYKWWSLAELLATHDIIYPKDIICSILNEVPRTTSLNN